MPRKLNLTTRWLTVAALCLALTVTVSGGESTSVSNGLTAAGGPLAIHGFDAVSYFESGSPQRGLAEFSKKWNSAVYRFANKENLRTFARDPQKYAPQFGGFCAYGVSVGKKFDGDPEVFRIVDNRLYFNLNPKIKVTWEAALEKNIEKAKKNWMSIEDTPASKL